MSNLSNQQINQTFDGLLQVPGGITSNLQTVQDGNGNPTGLQLSSSGASVTTSSTFVPSVGGTQITGAVPRLISDGFGDYVSVKDFGAVGNGVDDDTTAIQAAINASYNSAIFFPAGTYIASQLSINNSIEFIGVGEGSIIKQKSATNAHFISINSANVIFFVSNITINQNNSGQTTGFGKFLFNTTQSNTYITFENVVFKDFCEGALRIVGDRTSSTREVLRVINCKFRGGTESESGIYLTFTIFAADASELVVDGCDFEHGLTISKQGIPAISIAGVNVPSAAYTKVTIRNNAFKNYGRFTTGSGIGVIDCYVWGESVDISGNKFTGSYTVPIRGKTNVKNVAIIGNIMTDYNNPGTASMSGGISFVSQTLAPSGGQIVISDNIITGTLYRGIEISDSVGNPNSILINNNIVAFADDIGIYVYGCSGFIVDANIINGTGQQGIAFAACLNTGIISNNAISTTNGVGIGSVGNQTTLQLQINNNFVSASTSSGITVENVDYLSLQSNTVKDIVLGSGQRGFRVGGTTGINVGQIKNNTALGTYATAQYSVISSGFLSNYFEKGNSWNFQEKYASTAPMTGTSQRGDIVWNTLPASGGYVGWVCTVAGTPGTWNTFGAIV